MSESRREFLKRSGGCALGMVALATQVSHLGTVSAFAQKTIDDFAQQGGADYKALICLFWAGGNDGNNMIVPNHSDSSISNYAAYNTARGTQGLAVAQASLIPVAVPRLGNLSYGFHPQFGPIAGGVNNGIAELFGTGKLAVVSNVGTLVRPLTKTQYQSSAYKKPYQLFSHSDQVAQAQTGISTSQAFTGWGGRVSDKMTSINNPNGLVPMVTSIAGAQLFTSGHTTLPLAIADANTSLANVLNPAGFGTPPTGSNLARFDAFNSLRTQDLSSNYIAAASHVTDLAMQANAALATGQDTTTTPVPNSPIARQLRQVARLIKTRDSMNTNRQIFYVQIGGFDTHTNQVTNQANLFGQVSQATRWFWDEMSVQGMQNNVTLFTLSDFGRTLNPAGTGSGVVGSDHGWGNHMLVLGGSVLGGDFYGSLRPDGTGAYFPELTVGGPDDADSGTAPRGRWIPTTSVDQYAAVLARWFGMPQDTATVNTVFPNLANFPGSFSQLGFLP